MTCGADRPRDFLAPRGELIGKTMRKLCLLAALLTSARGDEARVPVLLELFTSEGCSSCPPADRLLASFDRQPVPGAGLIVLSEHVDYWNQLGWKDPFSSAQFSARQQEYTEKFHMGGVYTPQLVVDGTFGFVGSDADQAESAIRKAMRESKVRIEITHVSRDRDRIAASIRLQGARRDASRGNAVLYIAIAESRAESHVMRGENAGRSLTHVAVVRTLDRVGAIELENGAAQGVTISVPPGLTGPGLRFVAFLQDGRSGRVIGSAVWKL